MRRLVRTGWIPLALLLLLPAHVLGEPGAYGTRYTQSAFRGEGMLLGRFMFSPSVTLSTAYDDNIFGIDNDACARTDSQGKCVEPLQPEPGTLSTVRGNFALKLPYSHSYTTVTWAPQFRKYGNFTAPRSTSNVYSMDTRLNFSNGSILTIYDDYIDGYDSYRRTGDQGELQYGSADYVRQHPGLQYEWTFANQWGVLARAERTDQKYGATEAIDFSAVIGGQGEERSGIIDLFDYTSDNFELRGYRNFSRLRLYAAATIGRTLQDKSDFVDSSQAACRADRDPDADGTPNFRCERDPDTERIQEQGMSLGIVGYVFPRTQGDLRFGYSKWEFQNSGALNFSGLVATTRLDHMFSNLMTGYVGVERQPQQSPGNVNGYYLRTDFTGGVERKLSMHVTARAGLRVLHYHFSSSPGVAAEAFDDYNGEFELRYRPGGEIRPAPWRISLLYNPVRRESTTESIGYVTNRVTLSAQFGWF